MILAKLKTYAIAALGILALLASAAATVFRARAKQHAAEATQQRQRAEVTEASRKAVTNANQALHTTRQRHRTEREEAKARAKAGQRDHFEEGWK